MIPPFAKNAKDGAPVERVEGTVPKSVCSPTFERRWLLLGATDLPTPAFRDTIYEDLR